MIKFNTLYKDSVAYPCKLSKLFIDICSQVGLEAGNTDFTNCNYMILGNPFTNNEDCRTVLSNIAQLAGGFAKIGRDNKVYIKTLKNISNLLEVRYVNFSTVKELNLTLVKVLSDEKDNADENIDGNNYFDDFLKNEQWGELNSLVIGLSSIEGENTALDDKTSINENGLTEITIQDNYFLTSQEERKKVIVPIWNTLKGIKYLPFKTQYYGYPYLDTGDMIYIQDTKDNGYISYVFNHTFKFNGAFSGTINTPALTKTQTSYKNTFDLKTKFRNAERSIDKINGQIKDIIKEVGDRTEKETSVTQDIDGITEKVERIEKSAITSVVVEYALSDSTKTAPESGWSTKAPEWQEGKYMWQRTVTTYEDKTVVTGKAVCISGATGQQGIPGTNGKDGINGKDGTNGINGKDGISSYVHIKYSSVANPTDAQITEIPNKYIGICVNKTVADPTTASSYTWSKFEGKDGINGINGKNGIDGSSAYVHFAYSTSADGKNNFSKTNFAGATYIGVLTDNIEEDSDDYTKYSWSLIKGDKGIGINKVETQYYLSTSKKTQTGGSWKTTQDTWKEGTYYWIRTKITYDNNEVEYTTPILNEDTNSLRESVTKVTKTAEGLDIEVKKKVGNDEIISKINQSAEKIQINANKIDIDGKAVHFKTKFSETIGPFSGNDIFKVQDYIVGKTTLTAEELNKYDINRDGVVNQIDLSNMMRAYIKGGTYTYEGYFEINPYSTTKALAIYNGDGTLTNVFSLIYTYIHSLTSDEIICNGDITCNSVIQTSLESCKKNFEKLQNGLDIIKDTEIYKYNLKSQSDGDKKHIGFVIGKNYKYSNEITALDNTGIEIGVDTYSMISVAYKAIQEQQEQIEELQEKDKQKDEIITNLIKRIETLEKEVNK